MAAPSLSPGTRPNISVSVGPGLRAFTRIFLSASSALMVLAKLESPALIADIMLVVGQAVLTVTDEVMITEVQSMAIAAAMIGAITLARIVPDSRISNSILVGTR